ncbi:rhomboid family intramembrane serine protease [Lysinibacter cavernae]|uniref:Membrane associated rhomboid family serine protease n=1 Tax=Lysinibacter cavernae TaxID=1640652 RepID=A0A7X5R2W2_9MICO|nr:rhomboid family intramembrane serine protease [Lysinibacter cavernae]NIH54659.1 membrane associated rhomboid family serine protease [Lysinibacter cavernae]
MSASYGERVPEKSSDTCYRHPSRQSFVLCQRCGRTICTDCQTQAPVGVICPECLKQGQPKQRPVSQRVGRVLASDKPVITYGIIAICAVVYLFQWLTGGLVTQALWYAPLYSLPGDTFPAGVAQFGFEPWRMITSMFAHSTGFLLHIVFNMYTLWIFGRMLESFLGKLRFAALYLVAGFAGSVMVLLSGYMNIDYLRTPVVGASGAIFGLMGAFLIVQRKLGSNVTQLLVLLAINFGISFMPGTNIAWQAHVGGFIGGVVIGLIYLNTRKPSQKWLQLGLMIAWSAVLIALSFAYFVWSPLQVSV